MNPTLTPPRSLNERMDDLERRIDALDRRVKPQRPLQQTPDFQRTPACGKCGVSFDKTMGFVCPYRDCPAGIAPVSTTKV